MSCFWSKVIELWHWTKEPVRPLPRKCGTLEGMWTNAESLIPSLSSSVTLSRAYSGAHHMHTQIPTSLSAACNAPKDLFLTRLNARCHIKGSGAFTERKEGNLFNSQGHNLSVQLSSTDTVEVSLGQVVFSSVMLTLYVLED